MEVLKEQSQRAQDAIERLKESLSYDIQSIPIALDAVIQRFEFTYEMLWKLARLILKYNYDQECNSPRQCFKLLVRLRIFDNEEFLMDLITARNLTAHTYNQKYAKEIYDFVKNNIEELVNLLFSLKQVLD